MHPPLTVHVRGLRSVPDHDYTITETRDVTCPDCGEVLTRYATIREQEGREWPEATAYEDKKILIAHGWRA